MGTWPAVWMSGNSIDKADWPVCGKIDIMKHRGMELNKIFGTLHYPGHSGENGNGKTLTIFTATVAFHQYGAEWDANSIKFYADNELYHTVENDSSVPFNQNFFVLLNSAVGGNFGGKADSLFSIAAMEID